MILLRLILIPVVVGEYYKSSVIFHRDVEWYKLFEHEN